MRSLVRMFRSSTGYFSQVKCPKLEQCKLPTCIFSHASKRSYSSVEPPIAEGDGKKVTNATQLSNNDGYLSNKLKKAKITSDIAAGIKGKINASAETPEKDLSIWAPKPLPGVGAPATIQQRVKYITALILCYQSNNVPLPKKKAVELEYKIATTTTNATYSSQIKSVIGKAKKNEHDYSSRATKKQKTLTDSEKYDAVSKLIHSVEKLNKNQYITEIPTEYQFEVKDRNLKKCDRCAEHFYFDKIQENYKCQYHERKRRVVTNGGERTAHWECCDQVVGESLGCKKSEHHVFKANDALEMHNLIPFKAVEPSESTKQRIIGLDCEMGYTTKGLELIRLTVVDFFTGSTLFDEIVKPYGEILDLNTTWSGVSEIPSNSLTLEGIHNVICGTIIDSNTIIVGHGLENDLNALRLIHHKVVDTAIMFPKSLTNKYSLKDLSFQFLDRKIQIGEHSSEEDSLAAIDIVKHHIATL